MKDLVFGALIFIPPFFSVLFFGFFIWLLARGVYRKSVYSGVFWHPNLIDVSALILSIYISHLVMLSILG